MSTATLNSEKKKVLEPNLRFQGFEGKWKTCLLKDVTKYTKGFAFKSEDYQEKGIRIVRVSDLSVDSIKTDNEKVYIDEDKSHLHEKYKLKSGNIIITTVGSKPEMIESAVGRGIYIKNNNEGLLNQNMLKFENIKNVDNAYVIGLINSKKYQHYMKSIARGNANQANITVVDLLQFPISIPTFPEQQKIASFLSAVDEKTQQLSRKKELLEKYKKGVMQQLFTGKLRFKDENGKDYADWEEKKIGDFLKESRIKGDAGDSALKLTVKLWGKGVYKKKEVTEGSAQTQYFIRKSGQFIYSKLDFLNCAFAIIPKKLDGLQSTVDLPCFDINSNIDPYFLLEKVKQKNFYKKYGDTADGSRKAKRIHADVFCSFILNAPSLPEQQKIANFLSGIDGKIEQVNGELVKTQEFKKGLLQQLFV